MKNLTAWLIAAALAASTAQAQIPKVAEKPKPAAAPAAKPADPKADPKHPDPKSEEAKKAEKKAERKAEEKGDEPKKDDSTLVTKEIEYKDGDQILTGYIAYDTAMLKTKSGKAAKLPGVIVVHQWKGLGDNEKRRARMLADLGYVAFAADVYGKGIRPTTPEDAGKQADIYKKDRALLRRRLMAALDLLKTQAMVDSGKLAAIGYCFGGTAVLELARGGAPVEGVVSFHGGLDAAAPSPAGSIKAKVLALHGADDPHVPADQVAAFEKEMRDAGADWQLVAFGGAVHAFTDKNAGADPKTGAAYDEKADRRSWSMMKTFLKEVFKQDKGEKAEGDAKAAPKPPTPPAKP